MPSDNEPSNPDESANPEKPTVVVRSPDRTLLADRQVSRCFRRPSVVGSGMLGRPFHNNVTMPQQRIRGLSLATTRTGLTWSCVTVRIGPGRARLPPSRDVRTNDRGPGRLPCGMSTSADISERQITNRPPAAPQERRPPKGRNSILGHSLGQSDSVDQPLPHSYAPRSGCLCMTCVESKFCSYGQTPGSTGLNRCTNRSDMKINITLSFFGRTEEAVEFYCRSIEAETLFMMRFRESPDQSPIPPGMEDKIFHATFRVGSTEIMASDVGCFDSQKDTGFSGFSLALRVETPEKAERFFASLSDGGQVQIPLAETFFASRYGIVLDRFGVS